MENNNLIMADKKDDQVPILKSWSQLYWFVLVLHAIIIILFYGFSIYFS